MNYTKLKLIDIEVNTILWVYDNEKVPKKFYITAEIILSNSCNFLSKSMDFLQNQISNGPSCQFPALFT